jgi:hypothetical protein
MKFVHPEILWALTALAIPIIVHLFNFRKFKKVLFSNVEFLKEIKHETQSKSKLKHYLILLTRMLALAAIVFAFAQPYLPIPGATSKPGGSAVSVYLDNSFSMEGEGKDGRLFELAKNKAIEIVNSFQPSDKFQLLTGDFEGRHQRLVSRDEMTELIQETQISPVSRKLSEVIARQSDLLSNSGLDNRRSFILSDLQQSVSDFSEVKNDTSIFVNLVPDLAENSSNIYVDSVWFDTPVRQLNQPDVLHARVVNTGNESRENIPLQLTINGQQKSVASANVQAESYVDVDITYTNTEAGFKRCVLSLDDLSITKDDDYFFSYTVAEKINILEIRGKDVIVDAVKTVFSDDPYFNFSSSNEGSIDFGSFTEKNLIIINQLKGISSGLSDEIQKYVNAGGSVLIIPGAEAIINEYNTLIGQLGMGQIAGKMSAFGASSNGGFSEKVVAVNYDHYIFKNAFEKTIGHVDMPIVGSYYQINLPSQSTSESMMNLQSGSPFMVSNKPGAGRTYLTAVSLQTEESNFINHAFFPATLLRIAEFSQAEMPLDYSLGSENAIVLRNVNLGGDESFRLKNANGELEIIPEHRNAGSNMEIYVHSDLKLAGNYELHRGETLVAVLSFNYDRTESNTRALSSDEAQQMINNAGWDNWAILNGDMESIAAGASEINEGKKYWFSMIIWALIFLALEVLLIKFWR